MSNKIWIELEQFDDEQKNIEQAELATKVIHKLGVGPANKFVWVPGAKNYIYQMSGGTYWDMPDKGHWFNLDFLAEGE